MASSNVLELVMRAVADVTGFRETDAALARTTEAARIMAAETSAAMEKTAATTVAASDEEKAALASVDRSMATTAEAAKAASLETSAAAEKSAAANELASKRTKTSSEESSKGLGGMGKSAAVVAAGIGILAGVTIKAAADFQSSLTRLVTSAGESDKNLKMVGDGILKIATETGTGVTELGKAMYWVESGGQHGADGLLALKAAAQGAKAENADLSVVANALTSTLVDYHLKASQSADVTSKLVAATSQGKMTFEELSASLHSVLPNASISHIALGDILGDLASMTVHGESAQQATQNLSYVIGKMQNPSAIMSKELGLLGMTTTQLSSDLKNKGLSGTLQEIANSIAKFQLPTGSDKVILNLSTALKGLSPQVQALGQHLFDGTMTAKEYGIAASNLDPISAKQAQSFATLAGSMHRIGDQQTSGAQVMQNYSQAIAKATGGAVGMNVALMLTGENAAYTNNAVKIVSNATAEAGGNVKGWSEIQGNFNQKMSVAKANIQTAGITIGTVLLPYATAVVQKFNDWIGPLADTIAKHKDLFAAIVIGMGTLATLVLSILAINKAWKATKDAIEVVKAASVVFGKVFLGVTDGMLGGIGSTKASLGLLKIAMDSPFVLAIAIAAAVAAIAYVYSKVQELQTAIDGVEKSRSGFDQTSSGLAAAAQKIKDPAQRAKMLALARTNAPEIDKSAQIWSQIGSFVGLHADGGVFNQPHVGMVAEAGAEAIIPLTNPARAAQVMKEAGLGGAGGTSVNLTVNVGTFTGTSAEFDNLASKIYQSLMRTARANGTQLPMIGIRPA